MSMSNHRRGFSLARDLLGFQLKLLLEALRDVVMIPLALVAAGIDILLLSRQEPRYFRALVDYDQRNAASLDRWASAYDRHAQPENVDAILSQLEAAIRDPRAGARRARVLKRWAERQLRRRRTGGSAAPQE